MALCTPIGSQPRKDGKEPPGVASHRKHWPDFQQDNSYPLARIYSPRGFPSEAALELIIIIILVLLLFGSFPAYPYSRSWGYAPSGVLGTILLIVVILFLLHVI